MPRTLSFPLPCPVSTSLYAHIGISGPPTQAKILLRQQQRRRHRRPVTPDQLQPLHAPTRVHRRGAALPRAGDSRPA